MPISSEAGMESAALDASATGVAVGSWPSYSKCFSRSYRSWCSPGLYLQRENLPRDDLVGQTAILLLVDNLGRAPDWSWQRVRGFLVIGGVLVAAPPHLGKGHLAFISMFSPPRRLMLRRFLAPTGCSGWPGYQPAAAHYSSQQRSCYLKW